MGAASVCRLWRLRRASVGFLGMEMPQWLLGIFIAYLIVAVLVVISQPFKAKKRDLFGR